MSAEGGRRVKGELVRTEAHLSCELSFSCGRPSVTKRSGVSMSGASRGWVASVRVCVRIRVRVRAAQSVPRSRWG
jgi:hypothetical protein